MHTLQLVVKYSLKIQSVVEETIAVERRIVIHFNYLGTAQERF